MAHLAIYEGRTPTPNLSLPPPAPHHSHSPASSVSAVPRTGPLHSLLPLSHAVVMAGRRFLGKLTSLPRGHPRGFPRFMNKKKNMGSAQITTAQASEIRAEMNQLEG